MAMMKQPKCPKCGSYNVHRVPEAGVICNDCGYLGPAKEVVPKLGGGTKPRELEK